MKIRLSSSGIHIFNRLTGLNILLDELKVPSTFWAKVPRQVSIALTNICDLDCPFCFAPKNNAMLNYDLVIKWINELDNNGCLGIGFGGGEPTLHPRIIELCRYAAKCTNLAVTLTTHAHGLNEKMVAALSGHIHFIRVSMDGVGATYTSLRNKSFDTFLHCLQQAKDIAPLGINFLVNARTIPDLELAVALATDVGASEFLLLPEQPANGNDGIDSETINRLHSWVSGYNGRILLSVSELGSGNLPTCDPCVNEKGLDAYAHIDATGILKRSSFDSEGIVIGNSSIVETINQFRN